MNAIKSFLTPTQTALLCEALIMANIYYMSSVWFSGGKRVVNEIDKIIKNTVTNVLQHTSRHDIDEKLVELKWMKGNEIPIFFMACFVYKHKQQKTPTCFQHVVNENAVEHIRMRNQSKSHVNKAMCADYFQQQHTAAWSKLPTEIFNLKSFSKFKSEVREYLCVNCDKKWNRETCDISFVNQVIEDIVNMYRI